MTEQTTHHFTLCEARVNEGHTVRTLSVELGIDRRTLVKLEAGEAVHPAKAKIVADHFGVRVTDLMPASEAA